MKTIRVQRNITEPPMTEEKRRIYGALKAYRQKYGVGCFKHISEQTDGAIAIHTISNMYTGVKVKNETWLMVGEALEKLRELGR